MNPKFVVGLTVACMIGVSIVCIAAAYNNLGFAALGGVIAGVGAGMIFPTHTIPWSRRKDFTGQSRRGELQEESREGCANVK